MDLATDSAAHMSEEVHNAGVVVPRAIMRTLAINGGMALILLVTFLFCLPDVEAALEDPSGQPFFYVARLAWSEVGYFYILAIMLLLIMLGNASFCASSARLVFALARDNGLPFSHWLSKVSRIFALPDYREFADFFRSTQKQRYRPMQSSLHLSSQSSCLWSILDLQLHLTQSCQSDHRRRWDAASSRYRVSLVAD